MMEHFDIADMFGKRRRPNLKLIVSAGFENMSVGLSFYMENQGRAIAHHAGFFARLENARIVRVQDLANVSSLNQNRPAIETKIHPDVIHPINMARYLGSAWVERDRPTDPIILRLKLYCEDIQMKEGSIEIPPMDKWDQTTGTFRTHFP